MYLIVPTLDYNHLSYLPTKFSRCQMPYVPTYPQIFSENIITQHITIIPTETGIIPIYLVIIPSKYLPILAQHTRQYIS